MTRKGKKKNPAKKDPGDGDDKTTSSEQSGSSEKQDVPASQKQQPSTSASQQQQGPAPQQQQGPAPQQQRGPAPQQQRGPVPQQQRGPAPQQQRWPLPQQQQGPAPQQQQGPAPQQQRGPAPQQQRGPVPQQQRGPAPQQQRWPLPQQQQGPAPQQQQGPGPQQQQGPGPQPQRWAAPQQQQGPGPQQQRGPAPQPQCWAAPQQQQGPGPQQQRGPAPQQQQGQTPQQQSGPMPQQSEKVVPASKEKKLAEQQKTQKPQAAPALLPQRTASDKSSLPSDLVEKYLHEIPKRSNMMRGGTKGTPIKVETNMFKIIFDCNFQTKVTHYDVTFVPDRPKSMFRRVFQAFVEKHCPKRYPAFDGRKNAYSAQDLPFGNIIEESVEVFDEDRQQNKLFVVQLQKVAELDLSWLKSVRPGLDDNEKQQKGLQALDIILRHGPSTHSITVGKSLFSFPAGSQRMPSLTNGYSLYVGAFQSTVVGWKPYLNFDVSHKGFPTSQSVMDLMKELCVHPRERDRGYQGNLNPRDVQANEMKIEKFLTGIKVQYEIPGQPSSRRTQIVRGLVACPARNQFKLANGSMCTVQDYFAREKGYRIQHPDLPCLWIGSTEKKIYVPAELCKIPAGQVTQKKMDEDQTAAMIKYAATDTTKRKEKIMNGFASMRLNDYPTVKDEFKVAVHGELETVAARVLQAPRLQYEREVRVSKGQWRADRFLKPVVLEDNSWSILNMDGYVRDTDLIQLQSKLQEFGNRLNMKIGKPLKPFGNLTSRCRDEQYKEYFEEKKKQQLRLVIVVIPNRVEAYSKVKQITELRIGVLTQCLKANTVQRKLTDSTITNILLKINSKLNGVTHSLLTSPPCLKTPCILIGADVTHPSPDSVNIPSIAAVAASYDQYAFKYNIEIRLQPPREEMIIDLENIMLLQLHNFYKQTGTKPQRVIFYRDGVGDGDLPRVMHYEINAIKRAFKRVDKSGTYSPPITFLVVQKRHHIRLFPTDKRFSDDRNFNVQAGTIVDTEITHPSHIDFYLVSHASIQGTARPTKYKCICNENKQLEDEIEELTYYLCHLFARCTRSVSYPAPTYYAHLAAYRARALIYGVSINLNDLMQEQAKHLTLTTDVHKNTPMFFV